MPGGNPACFVVGKAFIPSQQESVAAPVEVQIDIRALDCWRDAAFPNFGLTREAIFANSAQRRLRQVFALKPHKLADVDGPITPGFFHRAGTQPRSQN